MFFRGNNDNTSTYQLQDTSCCIKGENFFKKLQFEEARNEFENAIKKNPNSSRAMLGIARVHFSQQEYEDCQIILKNLLNIQNKDAEALKLLIKTQKKLNLLEDALITSRKLLSVAKDSQTAIITNKIGILLYQLELYDEAINEFTKVANKSLEAAVNLGIVVTLQTLKNGQTRQLKL